MIFHFSIPADNPQRVAKAVAEIWRCQYFEFPPVPGAYTVLAGDPNSSAIEVYPRTMSLRPGPLGGEVETRLLASAPAYSTCHAAIATPLSEPDVFAISHREGWACQLHRRGGLFRVIEFWIENKFMLEILTKDMHAEYQQALSVSNWQKFLNHVRNAQSASKTATITP